MQELNKASPQPSSSPEENNNSAVVKPKRRVRPWLLLSVLVLLIALLSVRDDLRETALTSSQQAMRFVAFELLDFSPRDVFVWRLRVAGLAHRPLGQRWITAVEKASQQPVSITHQSYINASFADDEVVAHVYQLSLQQGQQLLWQLTRLTSSSDHLYASLERKGPNANEWKKVTALSADGTEHRHFISQSGDYRLVLQPELFSSINYSLAVAHGGSLPFPVKGGSHHDIGGGFGVARDGGARAHHGVDIFASKGTPVTAVVDGKVRIGRGGLGGNYLWLSDNKLGLSGVRYYYAHLDSFAVASGDSVKQGDTLGYVGNTGNAKNTPPHLHFGVYASGPVDPAPFLTAKPVLPTR